MPTKTFSSRADEERLRFADAIAHRDANMSFGQYCGSAVVDYVYAAGKLPPLEMPKRAASGIDAMLALARKHGESDVSHMTDEEIESLVAKRYE